MFCFGVEGRVLGLIVPVPCHCLSFATHFKRRRFQMFTYISYKDIKCKPGLHLQRQNWNLSLSIM